MIKWIKKIYEDYFEVFEEVKKNPLFSQEHPETTFNFYRGKKRRKFIGYQFTD